MLRDWWHSPQRQTEHREISKIFVHFVSPQSDAQSSVYCTGCALHVVIKNNMTDKLVTGLDILILSTQDWDYSPTRKHHFTRKFTETGNRVLYVEQQMHWLGWLVDLRAQFSRSWRWLLGPREVEPNLWVYTFPIVLPFFQMSAAINWLNNLILLPIIRWQLRRLCFSALVLWTYTPHSADFVGRLGARAAVYSCVDDFASAKGLVNPRAISRMEQRLIRSVDLLIVTSPALYDSKKEGARRIKLIPNGVDVEHFSKAADTSLPVAEEISHLPHPIVGYVGRINYWIDTKLLGRIAREHPEWSVVLVGPVDQLADMAPFKGLANVHVTGRVAYDSIPDYLRAFDVCVNPYVLDGVAEHASPLKLYEYVASGKPVVSVDMPAARQFDGLIEISSNADEFSSLVARLLEQPNSNAAQRMAAARKHTWQIRFEAASRALAEVLAHKKIDPQKLI